MLENLRLDTSSTADSNTETRKYGHYQIETTAPNSIAPVSQVNPILMILAFIP